MRYFFYMPSDVPINLYRFETDIPDTISEEKWDKENQVWADARNRIVEALVTGSVDFEEIAQDQAIKFFPAAFK
jgi:hypothetical protein